MRFLYFSIKTSLISESVAKNCSFGILSNLELLICKTQNKINMKAPYKKEKLQDPQSTSETYLNYMLKRDVVFCCEKFKNYCKKFTVWNYEKGKFAIVDQITYESHSVQAIDFCPFCGEQIEYEDESTLTKSHRKK